ncbi:MAG: DUF4384 domain-containing protein [Acidobacteriaceae bacterium]|nr:DUF4384 domain-containing protein [Acidobacteriaceae bacterium]
MHTRYAVGVAVLLAFLVCVARAQKQAVLNPRVDLVLEKKEGNAARPMDPAHVFAEGDFIRFRLRSGVTGFLYVMNRGSSGKFQQLFPANQDNQDRSVKAGKEYLVPNSSDGWFRVEAPPGYENVYFLISPMDLGKSLPGSAALPETGDERHPTPDPFATATPRCDDELFRARGECLDTGAGLKPLQQGEKLPDTLSQVPAATSRDLVVVKGSNDTSVSSTEPFDAPVIYHFKIAHK